METPSSSTAPFNLYAFMLKLRPLQQGTLMPFNGELVHAAWLKWIGSAAPEIVAWLHEGNKRRLFTVSSLQFPYSAARVRDAELANTHLPLDPEKTYTIRITLLLGELFPLFHEALMNFNKKESADSGSRPPFMQIGKQLFLLEEVIIDNNDPTGWTGFTSFSNLTERAKTLKLGKSEIVKLEFASLTTFNRGNAKNREYGGHHALLPLPSYIFHGLARRWEELAPPDLTSLIQKERIEQYCLDEGAIINDYDLRPHHVKFTTHVQQGFIGTCSYALRGPDEATAEDTPLTVRQQLLLLAQLAFYTGVGYKTAMGLGGVRLY